MQNKCQGGAKGKAESRQSHEICIMATKANKSKAAEEAEEEGGGGGAAAAAKKADWINKPNKKCP